MKNFAYKLFTLFVFLAALGCFYAAVAVTYPTAMINIVLVIISIFILVQGAARVDKTHGLGKYSKDKDKRPVQDAPIEHETEDFEGNIDSDGIIDEDDDSPYGEEGCITED